MLLLIRPILAVFECFYIWDPVILGQLSLVSVITNGLSVPRAHFFTCSYSVFVLLFCYCVFLELKQ